MRERFKQLLEEQTDPRVRRILKAAYDWREDLVSTGHCTKAALLKDSIDHVEWTQCTSTNPEHRETTPTNPSRID